MWDITETVEKSIQPAPGKATLCTVEFVFWGGQDPANPVAA